jgi:electron transport complex protein RnfG
MQTVINPSYRKRIGYHATLLGAMGLFASATLVIGNIATEKDISLRIKEDMQVSLEQAIPPSNYDNDLFEDTIMINPEPSLPQSEKIKIYRARMKTKIVAVAYKSTAIGYSGPIEIIMGIDKNGTLLGVRIISHSETPGLGDKVEVRKDNWITKFTGLGFSNTADEKWKVKKDGGQFDQFTGATITPRSVVKAIHGGLLFFEKNKETLFVDSAPISLDQKHTDVRHLKNKFENISSAEILSMINKL